MATRPRKTAASGENEGAVARTAKKATARKVPAKKTASTQKAPAQKTPARKTPARKTPVRKAAAAAPPTTSAARAAAPRARFDDPKDDPPEIQIAKLQTSLEERQRECDDLKARLAATEEKLEGLQRALGDQSEELGKLRAVASNLDDVTQDRNGLRERIDEIQVDLPARVEQQIAARLAAVDAAHADEVTALRQDRDQLKSRVDELEKPRVAGPGLKTSALAQHFADVLATVSDQPPASPDAAYVASVTGFTVAAKALLRATEDGEIEVVTPDPGSVPPDTLSTLSLDLKLLPRPPGSAPGSA